jgi:hypothetical protein
MDGPLIENDGFPLGGDVQLLRFANAERSTLLIGRAELQDAPPTRADGTAMSTPRMWSTLPSARLART